MGDFRSRGLEPTGLGEARCPDPSGRALQLPKGACHPNLQCLATNVLFMLSLNIKMITLTMLRTFFPENTVFI